LSKASRFNYPVGAQSRGAENLIGDLISPRFPLKFGVSLAAERLAGFKWIRTGRKARSAFNQALAWASATLRRAPT
jgi:hypothetical protein